jgi:hypothetical protein
MDVAGVWVNFCLIAVDPNRRSRGALRVFLEVYAVKNWRINWAAALAPGAGWGAGFGS